jgi:hypothetical protein
MIKLLLKKIGKERKGAPIVEIIIILAMSALIAGALFPVLRINLGCWYNDATDNIGQAIGGDNGAPKGSIPITLP